MPTLTKRDLVIQISNETGLVQQQVFEVIQRTLDHIVDALGAGNSVELRNFGILEVRLSKPRVGRNPGRPDSNFVIPARASVRFKAGKLMRQRVAALSAVLRAEESTDGTAKETASEGGQPRDGGLPDGRSTDGHHTEGAV